MRLIVTLHPLFPKTSKQAFTRFSLFLLVLTHNHALKASQISSSSMRATMPSKRRSLRAPPTLRFCFAAALFIFASFAVLLANTTAFLPAYGRCIGSRAAGDGPWRLMEDDEGLMRRAVAVSCAAEHDKGVKVAFMFLTRGRMPLMPLWERFFEGQDRGMFSVYRHTSPEHEELLPEGSVFFGRRIPSKRVEWGRPSMIDAERRLLATALLDPSNRWFVLLSESCIPLFNLTGVHAHLANSRLSFLGAYDDPRRPGRGRYDRRMHPAVTAGDWRKGPQWFAIHRRLAVAIVSDRTYYRVFRDHCRPPCYMDEHYMPTLVAKRMPRLNSNRSVTWADWSRGGAHPATYRKRDVSAALLRRVRRGGGCAYNGRASEVCYLFARKFHANTLGPLMGLARTFMLY